MTTMNEFLEKALNKTKLDEKKTESIEDNPVIQKFVSKYKVAIDAQKDRDGYYIAIKNGADVWKGNATKFFKEIVKLKPEKVEFTNKWIWLRWE